MRPKNYWKDREQKPERKEYQRKYKKEYMKSYRKTERYKILKREYERTHQRKRQQNKNMRMRLKKIKLVELFGGKCILCGYSKYMGALEFHHKNPLNKEKQLNRDMNFEKMVKEAEKCQLVCSNCHQEIHENLRKINKT